MRYIDSVLKGRVEKAQQTLYENANPSMILWISRYSNPLVNQLFLEQMKIGNYTSINQVSVCARRPNINRQSDRIYAAFCDAGKGKIVYADQVAVMSSHVWVNAGTLPDAVDIAVAFDGKMVKTLRNRIEFKTIDPMPWVFWVDSAGILYGKNLGDDTSQATLATANASAVSAIYGMQSDVADFDQGMLVFFILDGDIYYRQYQAGVWGGAVPVNFGPDANWVDIAASRTWDYRIVLQAQSSDGNIYELFTQHAGIAKQNVERINLNNILSAGKMADVTYTDTREDERIDVSDIAAVSQVIYGLSPVPVSCANINDRSGDWGKCIEAAFDYPVTGAVSNAGQFVIMDGNGVSYAGQTVEHVGTDNKKIQIGYVDFNAAYGTACTLNYTPGTVQGPAVALASFGFSFTPINLVPPAPAVPMTASNIDNRALIVEFNGGVTSANWTITKAAFAVTGTEYDYVPGGTPQAKTYVVSSVGYADGTGDNKKRIAIVLSAAGRLRAPQGDVTVAYNQTIGNLLSAGGAIVSFSLAFAATGLTLVYVGVNGVEKVEMSNFTASGSLLQITYRDTKEDEKIEITNILATGTLTHINNL